MKQYLDTDPATGISHWVETDPETGITTYGVEQEVGAILDINKVQYNGDHGSWGEWTHVASIPLALYDEWKREGILNDSKELKRRLNDPELRFFRTRPGAL